MNKRVHVQGLSSDWSLSRAPVLGVPASLSEDSISEDDHSLPKPQSWARGPGMNCRNPNKY